MYNTLINKNLLIEEAFSERSFIISFNILKDSLKSNTYSKSKKQLRKVNFNLNLL